MEQPLLPNAAPAHPTPDADSTAAADTSTLDQLEAELGAIEDAVARIEAGDPDALAVGATAPAGAGIGADARPLQSGPPAREETAMGFALEKLGLWTEGPEFKVEADRTKAYAAATTTPRTRCVPRSWPIRCSPARTPRTTRLPSSTCRSCPATSWT